MLTYATDKKSKTFFKSHPHSARSSWHAQHPRIQQVLRKPSIQPKLTIGAPNDKYEQEADRVADQVMQAKPIDSLIQRQEEPEEEEELLQAKKREGATPEVTPAINAEIRSLQGGGQSLSGAQRGFFEPQLKMDLSSVRVHNDMRAANAARLINARAFTLGSDVVFGAGEYSPDAPSGKRLLAHELTHVVQQNGGSGSFSESAVKSQGGQIQRDLTDPGRLETVHENVRVQGPPRTTSGGGTATRLPWVDPTPTSGGTAELLYNQIYAFLDNRTFNSPTPAHTTDANLDADAVAMHQRVVDRFPQIGTRLSDSEIQNRVGLFQPSTIQNDQVYLNEWMDNFINQMSDSEDYAIDTNNVAYRAMITRLINNPSVGPKIVTLGARQSAFTRGEGANREIFVHQKVEASRRRLTLIHEITHFYRHPHYAAWVQNSQDDDHYNEGITEWLARSVMTSSERSGRTSYQERVDTVNSQVVPYVSEEGIAQAFFAGDVWRLETRSAEAHAAFEADTGIREGSTSQEEGTASRAGAGLFQTVTSGSHYRFLNLGRDQAQPKSEHEAAFRNVKRAQLDPTPSKKVRFVGHASGPGSESHNLALSLRRSVAFYRMARNEGLPRTQMVDANNPPHFGESTPTVTEENAITRSMNRRVEMFLIT